MINDIHHDLQPLRQQLKDHALYSLIRSTDQLRVFMAHHIYSVWDFMNLLKTLQQQLTCLTVPWHPVRSVENARLINEIVLEEESDMIEGKPTSHFLYYYNALQSLGGADDVALFLTDLQSSKLVYSDLIKQPYIPQCVRPFLSFTHQTLQQSPVEIAAVFAFGRETLVPVLFEPLLGLADLSLSVKNFIQYLERHIELDGEVHGNLAEKMVINLCQSDKDWDFVKKAARGALQSRIKLWDDIAEQLLN